MELHLQCGWAMMTNNRILTKEWGGGLVILSPRDLEKQQLIKHAKEIRKLGGQVIFDPQFYLPHADHERLLSHDYWPPNYATIGFWNGPQLEQLVQNLFTLNQDIGSAAFVLPGMYASEVEDLWLESQRSVAEVAYRISPDTPRWMTIALSAEAIRDAKQIHRLLDEAPQWGVTKFYLVCEHPRSEYLVNDSLWLANVLDLAAGLRLRAFEVVIGYASPQLLCASVAKTTALASGTWLNVRSFGLTKFQQPLEESRKTKSVWYYCPMALSEYKVDALDRAFQQKILDRMKPDSSLLIDQIDLLFNGIRPSTIGLKEPNSFRHYLRAIRGQAKAASMSTYEDTRSSQLRMLDTAESLLKDLRSNGVSGQHRDFATVATGTLNATRLAIQTLDNNRGTMLRRKWNSL